MHAAKTATPMVTEVLTSSLTPPAAASRTQFSVLRPEQVLKQPSNGQVREPVQASCTYRQGLRLLRRQLPKAKAWLAKNPND